MNGFIQDFIKHCVDTYPMSGRVLEIGSMDICGSPRRWFTKDGQQKEPTERFPEYIGIDNTHGNLVDLVMNAHCLTDTFRFNAFDVVISTSQLEHDDDPFTTMKQIGYVIKPGGWLILTVPSWRGEVPHGEPDYWRFMDQGVKLLMEQNLFTVVELIDDPRSNSIMALGRAA